MRGDVCTGAGAQETGSGMDRRIFLTSAASASLVFATGSSHSSEWPQAYDAGGPAAGQRRSSAPVLSAQTIAATADAIRRYGTIAAAGGWPALPNGVFRLGDKGSAVQSLKKRLAITGDLAGDPAASQVFDSFVEAGVRGFQRRHGLNPNGIANAGTIAALNVPVQARIRQLELNAIRLRSLVGGDFSQRFVMVNIPGASIEIVENGAVASRHAAGVGKIDRQSPIMKAKITEVNFNPFWTVPASIIRKDLIPKMRAEPNYLTQNKIRIFNRQGQEVQPAAVNWNSNEATAYMFKQDPGGDFNSLGYVRINIPNPHGVYMHDTPAKGIFGDDDRFVSSGCVRVQNVRGFVAWLMQQNAGWDIARISEEFESGRRTDVRLAQAVDVYWTYISAWATPEGEINFREDIYRKDGAGADTTASIGQ